jgi:hypothetical protein
MKCICCLETDTIRSLRQHFSAAHRGLAFIDFFQEEMIDNWHLIGSKDRRLLLLRKSAFCCSQCGFSGRRSCGSPILEIDHIDGNHENNVITNLRVLCPNCHAMTPNYRNWNNKGNKKLTDVLRPGNKDYSKRKEIRTAQQAQQRVKTQARILKKQKADEAVIKLKDMKLQFEEDFKQEVLRLHTAGEIDFTKYGWVQNLADRLGEIPQVVSKRTQRLLPDFYVEHCFTRRYNHYKKKGQDPV